jgi:hypothetical protein
MYDPIRVIKYGKFGHILRHESTDQRIAPWSERLNPLRIEVGIGLRPRRLIFNRGGCAHRKLSNLTWKLWRRRRWERTRP